VLAVLARVSIGFMPAPGGSRRRRTKVNRRFDKLVEASHTERSTTTYRANERGQAREGNVKIRGARWLAAGAVAGAMTLAAAAPASAMDCFIAGRSARGTQQAGTNSNVWTLITLNDFLVGGGVDQVCADGAVAAVAAAGLPTQFSTRSDKTIGENSKNPNLGNGKGLEHLEDSPISADVLTVAFEYVATNCV
jgi:hypothetical protein